MTPAGPRNVAGGTTVTGLVSGGLGPVMAGVAGVVFDKDGTLVDLDARWQPFFTDLVDAVVAAAGDSSLADPLRGALGLTDIGLVVDGLAAVGSGDEIGARIIAEMVAHGHDVESAPGIVQSAAAGARFGPVEPIGDIDGALRSLAEAGCLLGLATSDGIANTRHELGLLGLDHTFSAVSCADDGGPVKPDPAVLTGIAAVWNVPVSDVVFVGDSRQDLATAQAAGARFIARCDADAVPAWAASEADAIVTEISALARHCTRHRPDQPGDHPPETEDAR